MMFVITIRALGWALARKPLVRQLRPMNSTPSTLMDALELGSNFRGYGWDWSHGVHIPRETRPSNRLGFILYTALSAIAHAFAYCILTTAIRTFSRASFAILDETLPFLDRAIRVIFPVGIGELSVGSIFDQSLPFYLRFPRSSVISILGFACIYVGLRTYYDLCTIIGVVILGQDPTQWPLAFDAPWRATSLTDAWGRSWQQWLRQVFLTLGGYPLSFILGSTGIVIGTFLASAVFHHIGMMTLNSKNDFWRMLVGFEMMAVGINLERVFKYVTRKKVRGLAGWIWTMSWILLWANVLVEGFVKAGLFGFSTFLDLAPPLRMSVEYLATEIDNLLHAISSVITWMWGCYTMHFDVVTLYDSITLVCRIQSLS